MCSLSPRLIVLMVLCVNLIHLSKGQLESMGEKRSRSRYCGRHLVQALQVVCNGVYNSPYISKSKKSSNGELIPADYVHPDLEVENGGYWLRNSDPEDVPVPLLLKPGGFDLLLPDSFRRFARGVHDDCCRKSCTFQELQMYCGRR